MRTLVDCGCETKVHADGSGVEIYYCPVHEAAPEMLKTLKALHQELVGLGAYLETCSADVIVDNLPTTVANLKQKAHQAETAIQKAKGEL